MTEHELEYLREHRAEADAGARERKAGHTPGPWKVINPGHGHPTEYRCVQLGRDEMYTTLEMLPADAFLIAASPDLYAACARAHAALDAATSTLAGMDLFPGSRLDDLCAELAAAREACEGALGRAEGEGSIP